MNLLLLFLGLLSLAQPLGLAAAVGTSAGGGVIIKTRGKVVVGKNTMLTLQVSSKAKKWESAVTDGVLTVRVYVCMYACMCVREPPCMSPLVSAVSLLLAVLVLAFLPTTHTRTRTRTGRAPARVCVRRRDEARRRAALGQFGVFGLHPRLE